LSDVSIFGSGHRCRELSLSVLRRTTQNIELFYFLRRAVF
jgi:hypothetical protein